MTGYDAKATLGRYLQRGRDALVWKLDGLGEYDIRRPMTATGTNLLGLIKHDTATEAGYFGEVFGRPFPEPMPWDGEENPAPNVDMFATADESRDDILQRYRRVWAHADETIDALPLDAPGQVPWWGEHGAVTLHWILVHTATEVHRHAGHADILRELIDGTAGLRPDNSNLPPGGADYWQAHCAAVEAAARQAAGMT